MVIGDLSELDDVHRLAEQGANALGPFDAVIHNAGVYVDAARTPTRDGHARVVAVNVLAPYVLTGLIERPARLIYISSGMHRDGHPSVHDLDWQRRALEWRRQAYCDSPSCTSPPSRPRSPLVGTTCAPTPSTPAGFPPAWADHHTPPTTSPWATPPRSGWPPPTTPQPMSPGKYWHHRRTRTASAPAAEDPAFQQALLDELAATHHRHHARRTLDRITPCHARPPRTPPSTATDSSSSSDRFNHVIFTTTRSNGSAQLSPVTAGIDTLGRAVIG